jgi:hypothetical protein
VKNNFPARSPSFFKQGKKCWTPAVNAPHQHFKNIFAVHEETFYPKNLPENVSEFFTPAHQFSGRYPYSPPPALLEKDSATPQAQRL